MAVPGQAPGNQNWRIREGALRRVGQLLLVGSGRDDQTEQAGDAMEATARLRAKFADIPPSEPSIARFEDGELVHFVPRHRIDGHDAQPVAADLDKTVRSAGRVKFRSGDGRTADMSAIVAVEEHGIRRAS